MHFSKILFDSINKKFQNVIIYPGTTHLNFWEAEVYDECKLLIVGLGELKIDFNEKLMPNIEDLSPDLIFNFSKKFSFSEINLLDFLNENLEKFNFHFEIFQNKVKIYVNSGVHFSTYTNEGFAEYLENFILELIQTLFLFIKKN